MDQQLLTEVRGAPISIIRCTKLSAVSENNYTSKALNFKFAQVNPILIPSDQLTAYTVLTM
jgi:hypothetical protein